SRFDELWRKYTTYSGGETAVWSHCDRVSRTGSYQERTGAATENCTDSTTLLLMVSNGYYDILWIEVDIEKINK
ncbi:hypothetical protein OS493_040131, partial [Desmophyllum pertusum]